MELIKIEHGQIWPAHAVVFRGMIRGIAKVADAVGRQRAMPRAI